MKHHWILTALAAAIAVCASAQTNSQIIASMPDDMGFYAGVYAPMYKGQESDVTFGFTYGHFNSNGLGYRTGFQFTPSVAEVDNSFGIPVAFAYRTRSSSSEGRLARGAIAAGETFGYDVIMGYSDPLRRALASFIANLFSQLEFFAGATPGFISGESSSGSTAWWGAGFENSESTWTERNGQFALSLDAGACANYRIWRFDLKLSPAVHYNLTKNYILHTETANRPQNSDVVTITESTKPLRWFFSFTAGLSYRF